MKKNLMFMGGAVLIIAGAAITIHVTRQPEPGETVQNAQIASSPVMQAQINQPSDQNTVVSPRTEWSIDYSPSALSMTAAENKRAVIFFHAGWCPTCLAAARDFETNIAQIPSDVTILKANYDTETELKRKYGVVSQDTFVQVDARGERVASWNSGGDGVKALLDNIQEL